MSDSSRTSKPAARAKGSAGKAAPAGKATPAKAATAAAPRVSPYAGFTPLSPSDEKLWAALIQLSGIAFSFVTPLIGYLLLRQRGPFVREHAVSALNWQLSLLIYVAVAYILTLVLIGFLLLGALFVVSIVFSILAAQHAHRGQLYTYPLSIRFLRA